MNVLIDFKNLDGINHDARSPNHTGRVSIMISLVAFAVGACDVTYESPGQEHLATPHELPTIVLTEMKLGICRQDAFRSHLY